MAALAWERDGGKGNPPADRIPTPEDIAACFVPSFGPVAVAGIQDLWAAMEQVDPADADVDALKAALPDHDSATFLPDVLHALWLALPKEQRPKAHPLMALVDTLTTRPLPEKPRRWDKAITPQLLSARVHRQDELPGFDVRPAMPGPVAGPHVYLPGLEPDAPPEPAVLLALFDHGGGVGAKHNGAVTIEARAFLEVLLGHPPAARDGGLRQTTYTVREMAEDWLQWRHYKASGAFTGQALRAALGRLRDIAVPVGRRGGFYYPVMLSAVGGWRREDKIAFVTRLPASGVGPSINRGVLRRLKYAPAWRLYVSLAFEWDRYGGHNGRLILPSRPVVDRAPGGQVVNAHGLVLTGPGGRPVISPHDPRAIRTGDREPNPARTRYPEYTADNLAAMAYPADTLPRLSVANRRQYRRRALEAARQIAALGGAQIEDVGGGHWRVMPPDPET